MSEQSANVGGLQSALAEASNPPAGTGCCGGPAANTGAVAAEHAAEHAAEKAVEKAAGPCCGTAAEADAADACCGTTAKAEAVASGQSCCG